MMSDRVSKKNWLCMTAVVVASLGTIAVDALSEQIGRGQVGAEIREFLAMWNDAISRRDTDAIRAAYSDDDSFEWFEDGSKRYAGREEIIAALRAFPEGTTITTKLSNIRVRVLGSGLAYVSASFKTRLGFDGAPIEFEGVFTALVRFVEGRWVFAGGHSSSRGHAEPGAHREPD